jgi:hypothetical protein
MHQIRNWRLFRPCTTYLVYSFLNDEPPSACRNEGLEDFRKVLRHLFESALDRFVLALIQNSNEFLDGGGRLLELLSSVEKFVALLGEVVVLLESLLVDV